MNEVLVTERKTAKDGLLKVIEENKSDLNDKEIVTEMVLEWEREQVSITFELNNRPIDSINHYRINRAIDLYFLIEAGNEFIMMNQ